MTAPTAPTAIDLLPTPPSTNDLGSFDARADATLLAQQAMVPQVNTAALNVAANAQVAFDQAAAAVAQVALATAQADAAAASAALASATSGAAAWVAGTYALNAAAISQINFQTYRKQTASSVTSIDPSSDAVNWVQLGGASAWLTKTTNYTAIAGDKIAADTTAGAFTITLPASPTAGSSTVGLLDYAGTFGTNNLTVARNGLNIMGLAEDMTISNNNNIAFDLLYIDATRGWVLV